MVPEGKGIVHDRDGSIRYEGEMKHGDFYGKGIFYQNGIKTVEGEWKDNFPDGKAIRYFENGKKFYEGEWKIWHQVPQNLTVLKSQTHGLSTVPDRLL